MSVLRVFTVFGLALTLAAGSGVRNAEGAKKKKHHIHGVVVSVHHDKDGKGSIKVRVHHHQKNALGQVVSTTTERKFHINDTTDFEKVIHNGKGQTQTESASFSDVHKGEHVVIVPEGSKHHVAKTVEIVKHPKKKA